MGTRNGQAWVFDTSTRTWAKNIWGEGPWRISGTVIKISSPEGKSLRTCCRRRNKSISRSKNGEFVFSSSSVYLITLPGLRCWLQYRPAQNWHEDTISSSMPGIWVSAHILGWILREKSDDQLYLHAAFVKDCLRENVDVPRDLKICLLEKKVNEGIEKGEKWSLVHGFPESIQEVIEFEEKVGLATTNQTLLTPFRCKKQITLCFSIAQLRCRRKPKLTTKQETKPLHIYPRLQQRWNCLCSIPSLTKEVPLPVEFQIRDGKKIHCHLPVILWTALAYPGF